MTSRSESLVLVVRAKNLTKREFTTVSKDLDTLSDRTDKVSKKTVAFGKFAGGALIGVGVAAGAMAVASVKAFADFEDRLNQAFAIMGDLSKDVKQDMSDAARAVGRSTRIGAGEAADAFYYLASAGYDAQASIEAVPQLAAFAQAGMMDMAAATDMAADAQSALGLKSEDAETNLRGLSRVTDVLTKGNILANASIEDLSKSLTNKAGAALRLVNKDVEEGVAVLAAFADQGIKAEEAGTALGIIMRDLQTSAITNKSAWAELGVSVYDSEGNMRNMAVIIEDLEGLLAGMSDEQKKVTLSQLGFNDKSVAFIQTLIGTSGKIKEYEAELRKAGGTTQEVADKQMESLKGQFELLGGQANDMMIGLGEELAPTIKEDLVPALKLLIESTGDFMQVIGPPLIKSIKFVADSLTALQIVALDFMGLWDEEARKKSQYLLLLQEMGKMNLEEADTAKTLATAIITLGRQGAWTTQNLQGLVAVTGASTGETLRAKQMVLEYADAAGYSAEYIQMLDEATQGATDAQADFSPEAERAKGMINDQTDALDISAEAWAEVTGETEEALTAQQEYTNAIKASTDPVFNAVRSLGNLQGAQAKVDELQKKGKEGTEEWDQAMLDLAEQTIGTQGALDELDPSQLNDAIRGIATSLGISDQSAKDLLTRLGLLDGENVTVKLHVEAPYFKYTSNNGNYIPQVTGRKTFAKGGLYYRGEPMTVGEDGVELQVPGSFGRIISNPSTQGGNFDEWLRSLNLGDDDRRELVKVGGSDDGLKVEQVVFQGTPQQMLKDWKRETKLTLRGL